MEPPAVRSATGVVPATPVVTATTPTAVSMAPAFTTNIPVAQPGVFPGPWAALATQVGYAAHRIPALTAFAAMLLRVAHRHWEPEAAATQAVTRVTLARTRRVARTSWAAGQVLAATLQAQEASLL